MVSFMESKLNVMYVKMIISEVYLYSIISFTNSYKVEILYKKIKLLLSLDRSLAHWSEFATVARETVVHSRVKLYQRLTKWYLISPCLTLSTIR